MQCCLVCHNAVCRVPRACVLLVSFQLVQGSHTCQFQGLVKDKTIDVLSGINKHIRMAIRACLERFVVAFVKAHAEPLRQVTELLWWLATD